MKKIFIILIPLMIVAITLFYFLFINKNNNGITHTENSRIIDCRNEKNKNLTECKNFIDKEIYISNDGNVTSYIEK